ncbi:MAG: hypothetical protein AB1760_20650 [Pseudomonadota bacterium]
MNDKIQSRAKPAAIAALREGDILRILEPCIGGVFLDDGTEEERTSRPGDRARVERIELFGSDQGWTVTVALVEGPGEGVVNLFDELDETFPFEPCA